MRLIIPHAYNVKGGVERTAISLIREFTRLCEKVVFVVPEKELGYYRGLFQSPEKPEIETFESAAFGSWKSGVLSKLCAVLSKMKNVTHLPVFDDLLARAGKSRHDLLLRNLIKRHGATHCLYMITSGQHAPRISIPLAAVIHDLFWHFAPERYLKNFTKKRDENLLEWLKKADILFAVSQATKNKIIELFPLHSEKIKVVPWGADMPPDVRMSGDTGRHNGSKPPIFFYPASHAGYQKNFFTLFKAARILAVKKLEFKVVVAGRDTEGLLGGASFSGNKDEEARVFYSQNKPALEGRVEAVGYCERARLEELYRGCACVVLPSKYEGYGLPLIEALSRGAPVICSDLDVFREQIELYRCGEHVRTFKIDDAQDLARKMEEVLKGPPPRMPAEQVRELTSRWTWTDCAAAYIKELQVTSHRSQAAGYKLQATRYKL